MKADEPKYRIIKDDKILYAGTGKNSWFTLEDARKIVNRKNGEQIVESDGINILWEVF